jgi:DNA-binding MarR family transcriptional regulator
MVSESDDAASGTEMAEKLHWHMFRIASAIRRREYAGVPEGELSLTQCSILYALGERGPTRLGELASREGVSAPTMTSAISRLEKLGMVRRRRDRIDKRGLWIEATDAGHMARQSAIGQTLSQIQQSLSIEEMQGLLAALGPLGRLAAAIESPEDPPAVE